MERRHHTRKIFIQRDYSEGTAVRFSVEFPQELRGKIDEDVFANIIRRINEIFDDAEALNCRTYSEGCLACLTGYTIHFCYKTHYESSTERVALFLQQQNQIYESMGVIFGDPMDRGLRCIEVNISYEMDTVET